MMPPRPSIHYPFSNNTKVQTGIISQAGDAYGRGGEGQIDGWQHHRMLSTFMPIIQPGSKKRQNTCSKGVFCNDTSVLLCTSYILCSLPGNHTWLFWSYSGMCPYTTGVYHTPPGAVFQARLLDNQGGASNEREVFGKLSPSCLRRRPFWHRH